MKNLILSFAAVLTLASCNQQPQQPEKFKFFHANGIELRNTNAVIDAIEDGTLYRLEIATGICKKFTRADLNHYYPTK